MDLSYNVIKFDEDYLRLKDLKLRNLEYLNLRWNKSLKNEGITSILANQELVSLKFLNITFTGTNVQLPLIIRLPNLITLFVESQLKFTLDSTGSLYDS